MGIDFSNQNIDVYRRQIITFEVDPHAVRLKVCTYKKCVISCFLMAVVTSIILEQTSSSKLSDQWES